MPNAMSDVAGTLVRGFLMGSADVVPGVSGGTVALVTGIYPRLVSTISGGSKALARFARGDLRGGFALLGEVDWRFLVPLVVGAATAVLTLAHLIETWLHEQPVRTAAVFLGMIVGTVIVAWRMLRQPSTNHAISAVGVGVVTFLLFGLQSAAVSDPSLPVFFISGALAICAFILPGVSGSFLLLSIGMYQAVLGAVNSRDLVVVAVFGAGAVVSLAAFSRVLERLLERHHDAVTAVLVGLMLGSLRILWPWPNGLGDADGVGATVLGMPRGDVVIPVSLALVAAIVVLGLSAYAQRRAVTVTA